MLKEYEAVVGLEIHAELQTRSKMFCACPVVDSTQAAPNTTVCPVCAGMPGTLPVVNQQAVEYGLRVALALDCAILPSSIFARKNYFYPDLPKGYQISQYDLPVASDGWLDILLVNGMDLKFPPECTHAWGYILKVFPGEALVPVILFLYPGWISDFFDDFILP